LAADNACCAFPVAEHSKYFTRVSVDPRGAPEIDKASDTYSTELFAEGIAAFMQATGIEQAHVSGRSSRAATGAWLAAKHAQRVR